MKPLRNNILCFGEVLWDCLPTGQKPGGAPMNVAMHLNAIGLKAAVASAVGNDDHGQKLLGFLDESGVNTDLIQRDEKLHTSEVLVHLDEANNASYEICEPVAWDNIRCTLELKAKAEKAGLLVFGTLASRNATTRQTLLELLNTEAVKLIDVNFRPPFDKKESVEPLLQHANIAKLNDDELQVMASWHKKETLSEKEQVEWLAHHFQLDLVCVTKGAKGAFLFAENTFFEHPGFKVKTVDTVGAGDAFLAGLVAAFIQEKSYVEALEFACATGAFVASKAGATPVYNFDEIRGIIQQ